MHLSYVAYGLSVLIGLTVVFIGARFLFMPRPAAAAYGVPVEQDGKGADAFLTIKGLRDGTIGLMVFVMLAAGGAHVLGWYMLACTVLPAGDTLIVLRHGGSRAVAYGIHGATAVLLVITAVLLLLV